MSLYENSSFYLIPDGEVTSKVIPLKPTSGGDFTFSRGSVGSVLGANGLIQEKAINVPRFDFLDGCSSLLLEPQRTNNFTDSEPTSGANTNINYESFNWSLGFTNCVRYLDNSVTRFRYSGTAVASVENTLSVFVIMDDLSKPVASTSASSGDFSMVIGGNTLFDSIVYEDYGNNIWRVSATKLAGTTFLANNGLLKFNTQSNKGFRVVGYQIEVGAYSTSYIKTTGVIATRLADSCIDGGDSASLGVAQGVFYVDAKINENISSNGQISLNEGDSLEGSITLVFDSLNSISAGIFFDGLSQSNLNGTLNPNEFNKIAVRYTQNNVSLWVNGVKEEEDLTSILIAPFERIDCYFNNLGGLFPFRGNIKSLHLINTFLDDTQMANLTKDGKY